MSANSPQYRVVALVAVLLAASVAPAFGPSAVETTSAASASFSPSVIYEERGDVANISVNVDGGGIVNIGSPSDAFWLQVEVGGGKKKIQLNTYEAGMAETPAEMKAAVSGGTVVDFGYSDLDKALVASKYTINATKNGNEVGVGALVLQERGSYDVSPRIAPESVSADKIASKKGVRERSVPPGGKVAHDDWMVVHVNATGVKGAIEEANLSGDNGIMQVNFMQSNPPLNENGHQFTGANATRVFTLGDTEGFYLAVDTGENGIEPGQRYRVEFVVPEKSPLADKRQNVSTEIKVVDRRIQIERNGPGKTIVVDDKTTIRGTTSLTPGTNINLSARDSEIPPFHLSEMVTVTRNRTFSTTFDFSDIEPGRNFQIRLEDQKTSVPAQVAIRATTTTTTAPDTTTATTTVNTTTETPTTTETTANGLTQRPMNSTPKPLTQQASANGSEDGDESDGGGGLVPVPGFGPVAGLLALLAGGVIAARRG
ncbi:BGTF surface domain-containing protein [Halorussus pelagicus]|uniref:BGTF surface domain-containing protein n=1 Tax=Halorussus pelagicus TaxID=2505977 RepID=UPI000FFC4C3A|nr:BGTF surface domain-containing protein [Halorussus pelagicus]